MRILVIDVGGTHIKVRSTDHPERLEIPSGPKMTAKAMVAAVKKMTRGWKYDAITIGYPGPVFHNHIAADPHNLGPGWMGYRFNRAFKCPLKIINDAAMQALGSYEGGRMLFLGLGTGLGSAMIVEGVLEAMELAHMVYRKGKSYEDYLGLAGLEHLGKKKWRHYVEDVTRKLKAAFEVDYVMLGGGNARLLKKLPPGARLGDNANAFRGGVRLWTAPPPPKYKITD